MRTTSCLVGMTLMLLGTAVVGGDDSSENDPLEPLNRRVGSWVNKVVFWTSRRHWVTCRIV